MPVGTANQQRFTVQQQQAVFNAHPAEADIAGLGFNKCAVSGMQLYDRAIKMRRFGAPQ